MQWISSCVPPPPAGYSGSDPGEPSEQGVCRLLGHRPILGCDQQRCDGVHQLLRCVDNVMRVIVIFCWYQLSMWDCHYCMFKRVVNQVTEAILILSLWILALLSIFGTTFDSTTHLEVRATCCSLLASVVYWWQPTFRQYLIFLQVRLSSKTTYIL